MRAGLLAAAFVLAAASPAVPHPRRSRAPTSAAATTSATGTAPVTAISGGSLVVVGHHDRRLSPPGQELDHLPAGRAATCATPRATGTTGSAGPGRERQDGLGQPARRRRRRRLRLASAAARRTATARTARRRPRAASGASPPDPASPGARRRSPAPTVDADRTAIRRTPTATTPTLRLPGATEVAGRRRRPGLQRRGHRRAPERDRRASTGPTRAKSTKFKSCT